MNQLTVIIFGVSALILHLQIVFANDSEFGRIISFDNFDHFSVSTHQNIHNKFHIVSIVNYLKKKNEIRNQAAMNRTYHHEHTADRARKAYEENTRHIQEHNENAQRGKYSFEIRANSMADLSHDAYLKNFVRLRESVHPETHPHNVDHNDHEAHLVGAMHQKYPLGAYTIPRSLDWRRLGFKTPAFNQATCGSCYGFSIATSIAGQVFKRTGRVVPLSVQQLVDCSASFGNAGCQGGSLRATFRYLASTKGLMRMVDYPYASEVRGFVFVFLQLCDQNQRQLKWNVIIYFRFKNAITFHHWPL